MTPHSLRSHTSHLTQILKLCAISMQEPSGASLFLNPILTEVPSSTCSKASAASSRALHEACVC